MIGYWIGFEQKQSQYMYIYIVKKYRWWNKRNNKNNKHKFIINVFNKFHSQIEAIPFKLNVHTTLYSSEAVHQILK